MSRQLAMELLSKNIKTIPIRIDSDKKKEPLEGFNVWRDPSYDPSLYLEKFENSNIAVLCGPASNIVVIDIDVLDDGLKKIIHNFMEEKCYSRIKRYGSSKKLPSYFYQYNNENSDSITFNGIRLVEKLSDGRYCMIPKSLHREGHRFMWANDALESIDPSMLPIIPDGAWEELKEIVFDYCTINYHLFKHANNKMGEGGRNNKLFEIMSAIVGAGKNEDEAVEEVLEYDLTHHDPPWSKDITEVHRGKKERVDKYFRKMYQTLVKKEIKNHGALAQNITMTINLEKYEKKEEEIKRKPLPHLRGMGKVMFDHIYENSLVQRSHYMFASVISTTSIILGNKIRFGKTLPNIYSIIVGESGSGKSTALNFPLTLFPKLKLHNLIGDSSPASDTGIIQNLPNQRVRLDVIDEGDSLFETILGRNSYGKKMASTYATLYTMSGAVFGGKTTGMLKNDKNSSGNIGGCFSPYVSVLVGTTPVGFSKYVDQSIIDSGFLARFLYFFDREKKRSKFKKHRNIEIPVEITDFVKLWRDDGIKGNINLNAGAMDEFFIKEITTTPEALRELEITHEMIEDLKDSEPADSKIRAILERSMENLEKIAIIDCALVNYKTTELVLEKSNIDWAREFILTHIHNTKVALGTHLNEGPRAELYNKILSFINSTKGEVKLSEIGIKFKNYSASIKKEILADLHESGKVRSRKDGRIQLFSKIE